MAEIDDILQRYGEGYRDPRLGMDSADYSTHDVLSRMQDQPWFTKAMRHLASYLPTDDREDRQRGRDEPWMNWWARTNLDSGAGPALTAAVKGGLNTGANWLEGKPEIGPDTLAPLGMAAMGMPLTRAMPRPALREWATPHMAERPYEWPVEAAVKVDDHIFTGPNHIDGLMKAQAALGEDVFLHRLQGAKQQGIEDGFVTNTGRYVTREEAGRLADERNQTNHFGISRVTGRPKQGMDSFLGEALKNYDPKTGKEILADSSRASLPGVLVNAAEQAERPVAAATRYNGEIFTGATHGQTIPAALAKYPEAERFLLDTVGHDADGFVTNTGRFVTRAEALALADAAGWSITRGRNMGLDAVELRANAAPPQRPRSVGDMLKQYGEDAQ